MALKNLVVRLAVGNAEGPNSATIRIWSPTGKSDVFASVRERAGDFKVSLHESGECNAGLTKQFADKEAGALNAMGGSRHQSKWMRIRHAGLRVVTPLQFVLPASELRTWRQKHAQDTAITWIDPPPLGHSIVVSCVFSGQGLSDDQWPGRTNETHLVDSKLLPNGEKLWIFWQDCPTTTHEQSLLAEARTIMGQRRMVRFSGIADDSPPAPRILIFKEFQRDQLLLVLDAAEDSLAPIP
jgi:hypothetical protein